MSNLTANELIELLHELDLSEWELESPEEFVAKIAPEKWDIPYSDVLWFLEWDPASLKALEQWVLHPYGSHTAFFPTWDEYLEFIEDACYEGDPHQPLDGWVREDAGLSGVYYFE